MYSEHLWAVQAEVNNLGSALVQAIEAGDEASETICHHQLYGIALTLKLTNEWNKHWETYFANATYNHRIDTNILEHFDFLKD